MAPKSPVERHLAELVAAGKAPPHADQPLYLDVEGRPRFRENAIVRYLLDLCTDKGVFDMNTLTAIQRGLRTNPGFAPDDYEHFAQLIGYSVSGYSELDYVSDAAYARANEAAKKLEGEG